MQATEAPYEGMSYKRLYYLKTALNEESITAGGIGRERILYDQSLSKMDLKCLTENRYLSLELAFLNIATSPNKIHSFIHACIHSPIHPSMHSSTNH